ncbi:ATP-binding protein [Gimesia aquarii]|uniref:Magnesium chelatase ChlI-like catalytic domain-containing protein n=1 Tax=Gimesia aquarii TaxID=2527964 RepID=A0A517VQG3_9PLAN|nr:ATP-binding protein [Gimesia aquarii]QDT95242.1 hypothetical protein V144x_06830 [Gimesia aquarii]
MCPRKKFIGFYTGNLPIEAVEFCWTNALEEHGQYDIDYSDVKGQEYSKRAITVAVAGMHHLLK